jgi:biotin transporter BioY
MITFKEGVHMNPISNIPRPLVRANQWVIVISVVAFLLFRMVGLLLIPLLSGISSLLFNVHPIMEIAKRFLSKPLNTYVQEDRQQQRFNQILAVALLSMAFVSALLGWMWLSLLFSVMVLTACSLAILGFCIGCAIHYQISLWRQRKLENS